MYTASGPYRQPVCWPSAVPNGKHVEPMFREHWKEGRLYTNDSCRALCHLLLFLTISVYECFRQAGYAPVSGRVTTPGRCRRRKPRQHRGSTPHDLDSPKWWGQGMTRCFGPKALRLTAGWRKLKPVMHPLQAFLQGSRRWGMKLHGGTTQAMVNWQTTSRYLCVLSDATAATAERVVRATLAQFGKVNMTLEVFPKIATSAELQRAITQAKRRRALIAYTLVSRPLRTEIALLANEAGLPTVDLLGPLLSALVEFLRATPTYEAGLYKAPDDNEPSRSEAAIFAVHHDDGHGLHDLDRADVVIVGPSRTSKTPLSVYLAYTHGLKVANVPLALGVKPFEELERVDGRRVIALTISVPLLVRIRQERQEHLGTDDISYADPAHVQRELRFCHELYRQHPAWSVINVTGRSIEEIAGDICTRLVVCLSPK